MASIEQLSYQDKISIIRSRYKSTKDLYVYMTERRKLILLLRLKFVLPYLVGYLMPTLKNCRLQHI